ncbi:MAG: hypothetical protein ACJ75H_11220 [Thermoanaerobaculia bacterium]
MSTQPDFFLYDRIGRLAAVIEVRHRLGTSGAWAAELRRNLLAHSESYRGAPLFLLVTPDILYVWKDAPTDLEESSPPAPPDFVVDARPLFGQYFEQFDQDEKEIGRETFESIVRFWLGDLIMDLPEVRGAAELRGSGFPEVAKDGRVYAPLAA